MAFDSESAREAGRKSSRSGVPNKVSNELKALLNEVSREAVERIVVKMDDLRPKELISLLSVSARYVLPTLSSIQADIETSSREWHELSKEEKSELIKFYFDEKEGKSNG